MKALHSLALGAIFGAAILFAPSAQAADFGISVGVGTRPAPVIVDGGYYEYTWVDPVYRTKVYYGTPRRVIVTNGYYRPVYRSGVYVAPRSGIYFGGSWTDRDRRHHHHHHSLHDRHGYHYRDKPGRYR